jgi:hypothetical protein
VDKSQVLWEKDYGEYWKFANIFGVPGSKESDTTVLKYDEDYYEESNESDSVIDGLIYVRPKDSEVRDLDAITNHLSSIKCNMRNFIVLYFLMHLPILALVSSQLFEYYVQKMA